MISSVIDIAQNKWQQLLSTVFPCGIEQSMTIEVFHKLTERYRLSDYLTYRYADNHSIWLADNPGGMDSLLLGFELSPVIVAGERVTDKIEKILSRLPAGAVVHSIAHARPDIHHFLEQWTMARCYNQAPIFDAMTRRRDQYMLRWAKGEIHPLLGSSFGPRTIRYYWFLRLPGSALPISADNMALALRDAESKASLILGELQAAGLGVMQLSESAMIRCLQRMIRWQSSPMDIGEAVVNTNAPVARQVVDLTGKLKINHRGDLQFCRSDQSIERHMRVLTATQFPTTPFYLAQMAECIGSIMRGGDYIPGDFYAYTVMEVVSKEATIFSAAKKMGVLQYQTASTKEFWQQMMRHLYQRKHNVQDLFDAIDKQGYTPVRAWSGMLLSADSPEKLAEATGIVQSLWKSVGLELFNESDISLPLWLASLPGQYRPTMEGSHRGLQRGTTMLACNAATLSHVQGDWQGSPPASGGLLVMSRRGVLTTINLFDTVKSNYNVVMAAASGSGKSFMVNEMVTDFLARGGMVRIIDAGRSYYHTTEVIGGENLVFQWGAGLCVNPFSALVTAQDLKEDMDTLVTLISQMAFPFGFADEAGLGEGKPYEYRCIEEAIEVLWQRLGEAMSVRDIADYFAEKEEPALVKISHQLRPWAYGRYADWMVGKANVNFDNPLLVLELDELADEPELQTVVLNLVLAKISREMYLTTAKELKEQGKRLPKLVVIDEAWDLLGRKNTGDFIEKAYRRARKYMCSIIIVTQSFSDCDKTSAARSALENANWVITLVHDIAALEQAINKQCLHISAYSQTMIKSLQKTDQYSEFYIINKSLKAEGLYRLVVDPATYWTYTSDAKDRQRLNELVNEEGMTIDAAIELMANEKC